VSIAAVDQQKFPDVQLEAANSARPRRTSRKSQELRSKKSRRDRQPVSAWNARTYPQPVTAALQKLRRELRLGLLADFREEHGGMRIEALAEYLNMSLSAIYGAVAENPDKCSCARHAIVISHSTAS
jgi:hypothetical protein